MNLRLVEVWFIPMCVKKGHKMNTMNINSDGDCSL